MVDTDVGTRTATDLSHALHRRELSSRELLQAYRARIDELNPAINAVVTWDDRAAETAAAADDAAARGELWGPLHGLPITVKDSLRQPGCGPPAAPPSGRTRADPGRRRRGPTALGRGDRGR
jgi:amidase